MRKEEKWRELRKSLRVDFDRTVELWDYFVSVHKNGKVQVRQKDIIDKVFLLNSEDRFHRRLFYACIKRMEEENLITIDKSERPRIYILNKDAMKYFLESEK